MLGGGGKGSSATRLECGGNPHGFRYTSGRCGSVACSSGATGEARAAPPWPCAHRDRHGAAHDRARRDDRERRLTPHPAVAGLQRRRPRMDHHRLCAVVRQPAAARRTPGRHLRAAPHLHRRHRRLLGRVAAGRLCHHPVVAALRPRAAGVGCRDDRTDRPGSYRHYLSQWARRAPGRSASTPA